MPDDTRGIVNPARMLRHVSFARYPVPAELEGLIAFGWSVEWDLPTGFTHSQQVLPFPTVNLSVGDAPPPGDDPGPGPFPVRAYLTGVTRTVTTRVLVGRGRNVAVRSTIGGFGAFIDDVSALDEVEAAEPPAPVGGPRLDHSEIEALAPAPAIERLFAHLVGLLDHCPARRVAAAREVATWSAAAEADHEIRTVGQLAGVAGVTPRTLQRMFVRHAGISPTWVLRRFRLLEAIERVRGGQEVSWAEIAVELGYADQAHLTRDFTRTIGVPPSEYASRQG